MQNLKLGFGLAVTSLLMASVSSHAAKFEHPDFSGVYNIAQLTPLQRPPEFGENQFLNAEEAQAITAREAAQTKVANSNTGPSIDAPPEGGAPPIGAGEEAKEALGAGSVGGYNSFWVDRGDSVLSINGKFRTSIITDPPNGRMPGFTPQTMKRFGEQAYLRRPNDGTAWWVDLDKPGPYDGPESLADSERCIVGFGSTGGPPMLPVLYNNFKRIVQTDSHVVILVEMVHDARIVRMNSQHAPAHYKARMGDSIGWWDGDTLVVETTNFSEQPAMFLASPELTVTERFQKLNDHDLLYSFTVSDPNVWTAAWSGEYVWPSSDESVYEYACHEGNYSMPGILKGARLLEAEATGMSDADSAGGQ